MAFKSSIRSSYVALMWFHIDASWMVILFDYKPDIHLRLQFNIITVSS